MRTVGRLGLVGVLVLGVTSITSAPSIVIADSGLAGGGEYHAVAPSRVFDSRTDNGGPINDVSPLGAKPISNPYSVFNVDILGQGGVPESAADVLAVVVQVTITQTTTKGWLTAYGKGADPGISSILNFKAGQNVGNLAIVRPGEDGELSVGIFGTTPGTAHVLIDVFGWFSTSSVASGDGARLIPTSPGRILDTRPGTALASGESITLPIRGADATNPPVIDLVPDSTDVIGVVLNVTGISTVQTFLSVLPDDPGVDPPSTSNVNVTPNVIKANLVFVPVGADGNVHVFNLNGPTHVVVDIVGYLEISADSSTRIGRVIPLSTPFRTFDTREAAFGNVALGPGQAEDWSFAAFANSVAIGGVQVGNQVGVIGNLTLASLSRQYPTVPVTSHLKAWPLDAPAPEASNLNVTEGAVVPNLAVFRYGTDSSVSVYNRAGFSHYLFDASAVILGD